MAKKVCVIGAGPAGICAVKACLEEGLQPVCYEMRGDIGGLWNYNANEKLGRARVYKSLVTNVSKEAACYSDFPMPKEWSPFITYAQYHEYFKNYATNFELWDYIHLNTEVLRVTESELQGRSWKVSIRKLKTSQEEVQEFDCVMVCSGPYARKSMPNIKGLDGEYTGKVMHSCEYDVPKDFSGKRVLIIGLGNSSADMASEVCMEAANTILSTRSGAWIVPRVFRRGLPGDMTTLTRLNQSLRNALPESLANWIARKLMNSGFHQETLGFQSRYEPMDPASSYLVNDELPSKIISGRVKMRGDIEEFKGNKVHFLDGSSDEVDVVICATGYKQQFPFLSNDILADDYADMKLYEWMFPFNLTDPSSLAVVGTVPANGGSAIPVVECQTRYITQVMSGRLSLPSAKKMRTAFEEDRVNYFRDNRPFNRKHRLGFMYTDKVATMGGFCPGFWYLFFRDPRLAFAVHTGPFMSYHYRLVGPHTWSPARDRIFNAIANTLYGLTHH